MDIRIFAVAVTAVTCGGCGPATCPASAYLVTNAHARGIGDFREGLLGHLEAAPVEGVGAQVARAGATAVHNFKEGSVDLVGGAVGARVLWVRAARRVALAARNPEVGGPCVEDNLEVLGWSAEGDLAVVLGVAVVVYHDVARVLDLGRSRLESHLGAARGNKVRIRDLAHFEAVDFSRSRCH